jgi:endonuclease-3
MTGVIMGDWIVEGLKELYPEAGCGLTFDRMKPYQLIVAGRLSAQCTDKRVNEVTKLLFDRYPDMKSLADADITDVEEIVRPCGLYHTKAANIINICKELYYKYNSNIPDSIDELIKLPGVGRKIANLIMGDVFGQPAYVADTHCIRISGRLGLTGSRNPERVEADLRDRIPPEESNDFCHRMVLFGREYCKAQNPSCTSCPLIAHIKEHDPIFCCRMEKL